MSKLSLIKVVLSTGKVAYMKEMKISHTELAAQQVSARANGDSNVLQILMQKALVQILLVKYAKNETEEAKNVTGQEKEDMDSLFTMAEYGQLLKVVAKLSGAEEMGKEPRIEMVAPTDS